jgi:hypothetical protein
VYSVEVARVFISYRHIDPDQAIAQQLAQALAHHEIFIDTNIRPGEEWGSLIGTHLDGADFLIAIVSEASAGRDTVVEEVRRAHEAYVARKKPAVIPVRLGAFSVCRIPSARTSAGSSTSSGTAPPTRRA